MADDAAGPGSLADAVGARRRRRGAVAYVKLISAEGHEFFVDRQCAQTSGTIKAMLSGSFTESSGEIKFPEISTPILL